MAKTSRPLTDTTCKTAKATPPKNRKLFDGGGLFLFISPTGGKLWRIKYRWEGKEQCLSLGAYPTVGLKAARSRREEVHAWLSARRNPAAETRRAELVDENQMGYTLREVAEAWMSAKRPGWVASYADKMALRLRNLVYPALGELELRQIHSRDIRALVQSIAEGSGAYTARRVRLYLSQIYRFAIPHERATSDLAADLRDIDPSHIPQRYATKVEPGEVGAILRAIDRCTGRETTLAALKLLALTFVRPGELRGMEWREISWEDAEWRISPERLKMSKRSKQTCTAPHIVPLSTQSLEILRQLQLVTGGRKLVFPGATDRNRPMSDGTINSALRRAGLPKAVITGHGFRHMASTLLNEHGWPADAVEKQLAHGIGGDPIRAVYNMARYLDIRRPMMQAWADYLDLLARGDLVEAKVRLRQLSPAGS